MQEAAAWQDKIDEELESTDEAEDDGQDEGNEENELEDTSAPQEGRRRRRTEIFGREPLVPQETVFDQYPLTMLADGRHYYVETPMHERDADEEYPEGLPVKQTKLRFNTERVIVYSTYSMHEYDRTNSEVDPVASSAEYELEKRIEKMDVLKVR